jgi:hypothetical protein
MIDAKTGEIHSVERRCAACLGQHGPITENDYVLTGHMQPTVFSHDREGCVRHTKSNYPENTLLTRIANASFL